MELGIAEEPKYSVLGGGVAHGFVVKQWVSMARV